MSNDTRDAVRAREEAKRPKLAKRTKKAAPEPTEPKADE